MAVIGLNQVTMTSLNYIAFMAHIEHDHFQYLEDTLLEYDVGHYIIAFEHKNYDHFHFYCQLSEIHYHRFAKRVFKDKFNLRGKAKDGNPRQYGKVKQVENHEKMMSYTLKDGEYKTNMTPEQLKEAIELSKSYNEIKDTIDLIQLHLEKTLKDKQHYQYVYEVYWNSQTGSECQRTDRDHTPKGLDPHYIRTVAIEYLLKHKQSSKISKSFLNKVYLNYLRSNHFKTMSEYSDFHHAQTIQDFLFNKR